MVAAPEGLQQPSPIRICPACGVIAPVQRTSCILCQAAFPAAPLVAPGGVGGGVFARFHEADFECRGCGLRTPVDLGFGPEAECQRCGLVQAFAPGQWEEALEKAHALADLCGPDPEGRFPGVGMPVAENNPHKTLGVVHTFTESTQTTTIFEGGSMKRLTLRAKVSAGHPVCAACQAPLDVTLDGGGNARAVCPRCGKSWEYALPAGAAEKAPALRAVLGEPYQKGPDALPSARIERSDAAGVAAILCPSCGAALEVVPGASIATCQYCRTSARIAKPAWVRASGAAPPSQPFWVLLQGPSDRRRELGGEAVVERAEAAQDAWREGSLRRAATQKRWRETSRIVGICIALAVIAVAAWSSWRATRAPAKPPPAKAHPAKH